MKIEACGGVVCAIPYTYIIFLFYREAYNVHSANVLLEKVLRYLQLDFGTESKNSTNIVSSSPTQGFFLSEYAVMESNYLFI